MSKHAAVVSSLERRTKKSLTNGGDGYVDTVMLSFDVGLCLRKIRQILVVEMAKGLVEKKPTESGKPCFYRFVIPESGPMR